MKPILASLLILLSFTLGACSHLTPKADISVGAHFQLKQPITLQPDQVKQFIQYGQLTGRQSFNRFDQHCRLEVKQLSEQPQTIQPDNFEITEIALDEEWIALKAKPQPIELAANLSISAAWMANSESDVQREESFDLIHLELKPTAKNPNIFRLTCAGSLSDGNPLDAPRSHRPGKTQINQILGAIGQIH